MALTTDQANKFTQLGYQVQPNQIATPLFSTDRGNAYAQVNNQVQPERVPSQVVEEEVLPPEQVIPESTTVEPIAPLENKAMKGMEQAYGEMEKAINAGAKAKAAEMDAATAIQDKFITENEKSYTDSLKKDQEYQGKMDEHEQKLQNAMDDFGAEKVDPNKYWSDMSTGGKVMAGIALALGAFGAATNGGKNTAVDVIEANIARDIDAQKANIANKGKKVDQMKGLYGDMLSRFNNDKQATAATRAIMIQGVQAQLNKAASKYTGADAQANAQMANAKLDLSKNQAIQDFQKASHVQSVRAALSQGKGNVYDLLDTLPPEQAKELGGMAIHHPTLGISGLGKSSTERIKVLNTALTDISDAVTGIDKLIDIGKRSGREFLPSEKAAEAQMLASLIKGKLRVEVTGPGVLSPADWAMLDAVVSNPTNVKQINAAKVLTELSKTLKERAINKAKAEGLQYSGPKTLKKVE